MTLRAALKLAVRAGCLPLEDLKRRLAEAMGEPAAPVLQNPRPDTDQAHPADGTDSTAPITTMAENQKAHQAASATAARNLRPE